MIEHPAPAEIIPFKVPRERATVTLRLPVLFLSEPRASERFCEFFTANIRNKNTRRAYYEAGPTTSQSPMSFFVKRALRKIRKAIP